MQKMMEDANSQIVVVGHSQIFKVMTGQNMANCELLAVDHILQNETNQDIYQSHIKCKL